jgi:hypothetical protein
MPRESLDAPDDLPKQAPCQVALGHLEGELEHGGFVIFRYVGSDVLAKSE